MISKVEYLVADTSAFIKYAQFQDICENVITVEEVISEVKNTKQFKHIVDFPFDLQLKEVEPENVTFVTKFSKKTGDYPALSATDINVLALTYQLEKQFVGINHLKTEPIAQKSVEPICHSVTNAADIIGFYSPESDEECEFSNKNEQYNNSTDIEKQSVELTNVDDAEQEVPDIDSKLLTSLKHLSCQDNEESGCDQDDPCALDDDDAGWITPANIVTSKQDMNGDVVENKKVKVACLTTDFAMQNVLKQIGLNLVTLDGLIIKEVKTFILRCYACFKTTSIMTKLFCPNCGNKTLKRVAVTVDEEGKEHIHINFSRPLTAKGKKFPVPKFHGGKHSNNPILSEDQRVPQQRISKMARQKNNPLKDDYIACSSPFLMRDISSKSAILGVQRKVELKSWMRRNPNEVTKKRRKK
ncbi:RNA-binding protein NOB1 [Cimex lectularius]|uniref:RNA-binding protein NOB1 n=1 Tax=Cimex lectularius TaxID=79782 RepID=A0A8I6TFZ0_CIMLE|nr:RNA-binding protein NOB1 [Cimex lectularius]